MEMYLAGVSVRRVEDITEALWGTRVSPSTVSELNQKLYERIEEWRNQPIEGEFAYVALDGIWLKRSWGGEVKNVAVLVAMGVDQDGYRQVLGVCEGLKEDTESWRKFLRHLKERGLKGVRLVTSDKCLGLVEVLGGVLSRGGLAALRGPLVSQRWLRGATSPDEGSDGDAQGDSRPGGPRGGREEGGGRCGEAAGDEASARRPRSSRRACSETLRYMAYPREHWTRIRTNNALERLMREIRRRTRVVGAFPDGNSALMLVAARLRHVAGTKWGTRKYLDMERLQEQSGGAS